MRDNIHTNTANLAESIVRRERTIKPGQKLFAADYDRQAEVKVELDKIADQLGHDKSYLLGSSSVEILDAYDELVKA